MRVIAARIALEATKHNLSVDQHRDKQRRLDAGEPTEIGSDADALRAATERLASKLSAIIGDGGEAQEPVGLIDADEPSVVEYEDRAGPSEGERETG